MRDVSFGALVGETLVAVDGLSRLSECVVFTTASGRKFVMQHDQDCCESVAVEEVVGNVDDLLHFPILKAEETSNHDNPPEHSESFTWTFYTLATVKGYVVVRWLGESNGYYSESVDFTEVSNA